MNPKARPLALPIALAGGLALPMATSYAANPCNPCAPKAQNPCAARNPCAASSPNKPSNAIDPKLVTRPKNDKPYAGNASELRKEGQQLWSDSRLSTNGMSCNTCHQSNGAFQDTFAQPYPHAVQMAKDRAGMKTTHADEMVQVCMLAPMAAQPLPWTRKNWLLSRLTRPNSRRPSRRPRESPAIRAPHVIPVPPGTPARQKTPVLQRNSGCSARLCNRNPPKETAHEHENPEACSRHRRACSRRSFRARGQSLRRQEPLRGEEPLCREIRAGQDGQSVRGEGGKPLRCEESVRCEKSLRRQEPLCGKEPLRSQEDVSSA
jgi:hypothetical protein